MIPFNLAFTKARTKALKRQIQQTEGATADTIEAIEYLSNRLFRIKLDNTATSKYSLNMSVLIASDDLFNGIHKIKAVSYDETDSKILLTIEVPSYNAKDFDLSTVSGTVTPHGLTPLGIYEAGTIIRNNVGDIIGHQYESDSTFVIDIESNRNNGHDPVYIQVLNMDSVDPITSITIEHGIDLINWHDYSPAVSEGPIAAGGAHLFKLERSATGLYIKVDVTSTAQFLVMFKE